jgi:Putative Actinobacterial Holin-X, holin superfamily III
MPTHATNGSRAQAHVGLGDAAKQVAERASSLARLEARLAALELKQKLATFSVGIGLAVGGAVLALFGLGFLFASAAAGIATALPMWAALLIVGAVLAAIAGVLVMLGVRRLRAGAPVPEQAIEEAKLTTEALRQP